MSESILAVLIPAVGAILVALISLLRQILRDRRISKAARVERQLEVNNDLLSEYRALVAEHRADAQQARAELATERVAHRQDAEDRDRWRTEAAANDRRIETYLKDMEKP